MSVFSSCALPLHQDFPALTSSFGCTDVFSVQAEQTTHGNLKYWPAVLRINLNSPLVYSAAICANSYSKLSLLMAYRQISSILWLHSCSPRVLEKAIVLSLLPAGATTSNCWPKIDLMDTFNLFITFRRCHNCRS